MSQLPALIVSGDFLPGYGLLNGRKWAGQQLLRLWGQASGTDPITILVPDRTNYEEFASELRKAGHQGDLNVEGFIDSEPLRNVGALFLADASIGRWAQWRHREGQEAFSLIGQIHTICTPAAIGQIQDLAIEPLSPWDALICSSNAGRAVVEVLLADKEEQLLLRTGGDSDYLKARRPQLPVIPLPIPARQMSAQLPSRRDARAKLGIPNESHVLVCLGRLSMLTKFDPWPVYQLLEKVASQLDQPLVLIECGQDDTSHQGQHFSDLKKLCSRVNFVRLGGENSVDEQIKHQALAAADVGLFLVDNLQETFGLALAEAMAAGLPVVASDWNGFRDLVRNGIDGFLVPSCFAESAEMASFPLAWQQLLGLESYPVIAGALAQLVQLDFDAAEAALITLFRDPSLARAMGDAARARAQACFDEKVVMKEYRNLFEDLASLRPRESSSVFKDRLPSLAYDPIRAFASYPSRQPYKYQKGDNIDLKVVPESVLSARSYLWNLVQKDLEPTDRKKFIADIIRKHKFGQ